MRGLFSPDVNFNIQPESPVAPVAAPTSFIEGALNLAGSFLQEEVRARRSSGRGGEGEADPNLAVFAEEVLKVESIRQDRGDAAAALAEKAVARNFAEAGYDLDPSYQRVYSNITGREFKSYGVDPVDSARQANLSSDVGQNTLLFLQSKYPNLSSQELEDQAIAYAVAFERTKIDLAATQASQQRDFVAPIVIPEDGRTITKQQAYLDHTSRIMESAVRDLYSQYKQGAFPTQGDVERVSIAVNQQFAQFSRPAGVTDEQWKPIAEQRKILTDTITSFKNMSSDQELKSKITRALGEIIDKTPGLSEQQALGAMALILNSDTTLLNAMSQGTVNVLLEGGTDPSVSRLWRNLNSLNKDQISRTVTPDQNGNTTVDENNPNLQEAKNLYRGLTAVEQAKQLNTQKNYLQVFEPKHFASGRNREAFVKSTLGLSIAIKENTNNQYLSSEFTSKVFSGNLFVNLESLQGYDPESAAVVRQHLLGAVDSEVTRQLISLKSATGKSAYNIDEAGNIFLDFGRIPPVEGRYTQADVDYFKEQMSKVDLAEAVRTRFSRIPGIQGTNVGFMRIVQDLNLVDAYNQVSDRSKSLRILGTVQNKLRTPVQQGVLSDVVNEPTATLAQDELTVEDRRLNLKTRGFSNPDAINSSTVPEASQGLSAFDQKVQSLLNSLPSFSLVGKANAATIESVVTAVPDVTSEEVTSAVDAIQAGTTLAEIQALGARQRAIMSSILNPVAPDQASTPTPRPRPDTAVAPATTSGITNVNEIARDPRTGEPIFPAQDELAVGVPESAGKEGVTDFLLDTLAKIESNNNPDAVSSAGAIGLYQIMENTAEKPGYGVKPLSTGRDIAAASPEEQRRFTRDYLNAMLKKFNGDLALALAAYNGGPGTVDKYLRGERDLPEETKNYVRKFARAGVVVGIAPKPPVPRPRPDTATATPTPRPRPRPDTATQSATSQRVSEALSRSESRTQGRKQLNEEALSEVKSEDKATSWLDSLTSTVAKTLFGSGVEFAELEDITKQAIRYANRNPIDFIYNSNLVGLDENNPDHQEAIAGFINRFVPGRVENPSEVEKDANAWCAAFAGHVLSNLGVAAPQGEGGFNALRAAQYKNLGKEVSREDAQSGDLVIIRNRTTGRHHVGFFVNSSDQGVAILGGNQNDQVNVTRYPNNRDYSFRRIDGMESISPEALKAVQSDISEFSGMSLTNLLHRII